MCFFFHQPKNSMQKITTPPPSQQELKENKNRDCSHCLQIAFFLLFSLLLCLRAQKQSGLILVAGKPTNQTHTCMYSLLKLSFSSLLGINIGSASFSCVSSPIFVISSSEMEGRGERERDQAHKIAPDTKTIINMQTQRQAQQQEARTKKSRQKEEKIILKNVTRETQQSSK